MRRAVLEDLWRETRAMAVAQQLNGLDDRLGLNPRAMAALRWTVVADEPATVDGAGGGSRWAGLKAGGTDWTELRVVDHDATEAAIRKVSDDRRRKERQ